MDTARFFAAVRADFGSLRQTQVDGVNEVLRAAAGSPLAHAAYMLATAWHETNATMQPVREAYWVSEEWRRKHLRYWPHYGRGYVQLTWDYNYERADHEGAAAGLFAPGALMADLDLAMRPDVAAFVMRRGMDEGWFTGKALSTYLPTTGRASSGAYIKARRIINGTDKAEQVARYAVLFEGDLLAGGWA